MREIKFRSWNDVDDCMSYYTLRNLMFTGAFDQHTWMQYTGLKDKNGKEIYEGDIVRVIDGRTSYVEYDVNRAMYSLNNKKDVFSHLESFSMSRESEVIGNIYENPELVAHE